MARLSKHRRMLARLSEQRRKMAHLSNLPDELMSLILGDLLGDTPTLLALSQVSKRLHQLSIELLYYEVKVLPDDDDTELLFRTLSERPELAHYIHDITANWFEDSHEFFAALNRMLQQASNLRLLSINAPYFSSARPSCALFPWKRQRPPPLEHVYFNYDGLSSVDVDAFLQLPTLVYFRATHFCKSTDVDIDSWPRDTNSCRSLSISFSHLNSTPDVLHKLLSRRTNIVELSCTLLCTGGSDRENMYAPLSPSAFSRTLLPVWDSLKELHILPRYQVWPGHDGTRFSCRNFRRLVRLDIPAKCFFQEAAPTSARDGVYDLLPPSIVTLSIEFEKDMGFLRDPDSVGQYTRVELLHSAERSTYFWLEEILASTSAALCDLRKIYISEDPVKTPTHTDWNIPYPLEKICFNAGVLLHVDIRTNIDETML